LLITQCFGDQKTILADIACSQRIVAREAVIANIRLEKP
jgi:hypothetical protein